MSATTYLFYKEKLHAPDCPEAQRAPDETGPVPDDIPYSLAGPYPRHDCLENVDALAADEANEQWRRSGRA